MRACVRLGYPIGEKSFWLGVKFFSLSINELQKVWVHLLTFEIHRTTLASSTNTTIEMKLYNDPQTEQVLAQCFLFLSDNKDHIHEYSFELIALLEFKAMRNAVLELGAMIPQEYKNALALEMFNPLINLASEDGPELFGDGEILELPILTEQIKSMLEDVRVALDNLNKA